jgi:zinc transporter
MAIQRTAVPPHESPGDPETGLIFARVLDGHGHASPLAWEDCRCWRPVSPEQTLWIHMDRTVPSVEAWLTGELGFSEATAEALVAWETRPRAFREGDALVTVLRGINFNPNAEPEDMITLRMWARSNRVLTLRRRPLQTPTELIAQLDCGRGPHRTGDLVTAIIEQLVEKIGGSIVDMNEKIDELEAGDTGLSVDETLGIIATIRRNCLGLKRHMSPQHEALVHIARDPPSWLSANNARDIRETVDTLKRYLEDLDVSKESALVLQDDMNSRANAQSNRTVYLLSILAAVFLPISFVTGLLGSNVGGIPGAHHPLGFWLLVGGLAVMAALQVVLFRWLKWL